MDITQSAMIYALVCSVLGLLLGAIGIVSMWLIFEKAGQPGWAALIPFYNMYVLFKITWKSGWFFLFLFVPLANIVFGILTMVKLGTAFCKSSGFKVGLALLNLFFMIVLAFDNSYYVGVPSSQTTTAF